MMGAIKRGAAVTLLLFAAAQCIQDNRPALEEAEELRRAAILYLSDQQATDGGWHSETHAILRSGQALTPFILLSLIEAAEKRPAVPNDVLFRGVDFLRGHISETGIVGISDPLLLEYPNYATSYTLRVLVAYGASEDSSRIRNMRRYLLDQQLTERRGVDPEHAAYGGWGFGETRLRLGEVGHVDLSHTLRVVEALRVSGDIEPSVYDHAGSFLRRMQTKYGAPANYIDGGFYYSPIVVAANKGGGVSSDSDEPIYRSYATATCDGLLALLASGFSRSDSSIVKAASWLEKHPALDHPEGIPKDHPAQWHEALFYYHLAARAAVYRRIGWPEKARTEMTMLLAERIQPDGSFVNRYGAPNKENDPLLATALAVRVLTAILS